MVWITIADCQEIVTVLKRMCLNYVAHWTQLTRVSCHVKSAEILDSHDIPSRAQGHLNRAEQNPSDGNNLQRQHGQDRTSLGE